MSTFLLVLLVILMALLSVNSFAADGAATPVSLWALELPAADLENSIDFYTTALGFRVEARNPEASVVDLVNGKARITLRSTDAPQAAAGAARAYLNMSVGDLASSLRAVRAAGGTKESMEVEESAVGPFLKVLDPSGNPIDVIDHPWDEMAPGDTPAVFNIGIQVRSIGEAEPFFTSLGFSVSTRDYLPETLVFERQGIGYFVIHPLADESPKPVEAAGGLVVVDGGAAMTKSGAPRLITSPSGVRVRLVHPGQRSARDR